MMHCRKNTEMAEFCWLQFMFVMATGRENNKYVFSLKNFELLYSILIEDDIQVEEYR